MTNIPSHDVNQMIRLHHHEKAGHKRRGLVLKKGPIIGIWQNQCKAEALLKAQARGVLLQDVCDSPEVGATVLELEELNGWPGYACSSR